VKLVVVPTCLQCDTHSNSRIARILISGSDIQILQLWILREELHKHRNKIRSSPTSPMRN